MENTLLMKESTVLIVMGSLDLGFVVGLLGCSWGMEKPMMAARRE